MRKLQFASNLFHLGSNIWLLRGIALASTIFCASVLKTFGEPRPGYSMLLRGLAWSIILNSGLWISTFQVRGKIRYVLISYLSLTAWGITFLMISYGWIPGLVTLFFLWWHIYRIYQEKDGFS